MEVRSESSNSAMGHLLNWRKPRNQEQPISASTATTNPTSTFPSIMHSTRCKTALSSLILASFSNNSREKSSNNKKSLIKGTILLGLGCTTEQQVSVPGVVRSSAHWEEADNKKKNNLSTKKKKKLKKMMKYSKEMSAGVHDLWCGADAASVDCVRPRSGSRECVSYSSRQGVKSEQFAALDLNSGFDAPQFGPDVFESRYYYHLRNRSSEGLAELLMFQNGLLMGRRSGGLDRYRDLRLDVDNMTYEDLLELGERIGHVSTGLGEDETGRCLRKTKLPALDKISSQFCITEEIDGKCSICQEEYEADDEIGKLKCGHAHHLHCIKQWLVRKNACPVCKLEASQ